MGLDMYLYRRTYVKNWAHMKPDEKHKITIKKGGAVRKDIDPKKISHIVEQVGYWRKFNALHKWFVENVQNDVDDCGEYYVDTNQLISLRDLLREVLNKRGELIENIPSANKLLPTQDGFFFGGVEYDDWYYKSVENTIEILNEALDSKSDCSYYYSSSW